MFPFDDHSTGIGTRYAVCVVVCGGPRAVTRASRGGVTFPARMTLPPYSNAPFAKARVRCLRVCAGAEPGSCLRGRPISLALTVARVRPSPYRRSGIRVRVFRSPPPRGGGRPLPALWGRGYRFAAALAAWIALRSVRNSGYLIQFCSRLVQYRLCSYARSHTAPETTCKC